MILFVALSLTPLSDCGSALGRAINCLAPKDYPECKTPGTSDRPDRTHTLTDGTRPPPSLPPSAPFEAANFMPGTNERTNERRSFRARGVKGAPLLFRRLRPRPRPRRTRTAMILTSSAVRLNRPPARPPPTYTTLLILSHSPPAAGQAGNSCYKMPFSGYVQLDLF